MTTTHPLTSAATPRIAPLSMANRAPGVLALATAATGLAYSVSFVILRDPVLSSSFLMLGGLLGIPVLLAVAPRFGADAPLTARWGIVLALVAAIGSAVHGAYDLANALHPPAALATDLPNPVDPRGLLTFGVAGLALVALGAVSQRLGGFPLWLSCLAVANGSLLMLLYVARLVVLDPASPFVLGPALLAGFLLNPAWYVGLGVWFLRPERPRARRSLGRTGAIAAW
jgi:hypothetical protein